MIYLGADHRGFALKEELKKHFLREGRKAEDAGAYTHELNDDYPDFAYAVAVKIAENPEKNRGILICGSGMGMDVVANKVRGVRATVGYSYGAAMHARTNDDVNVITLAADELNFNDAKEIIDAFLTTDFSGEERHVRRLKKIEEIEERNFK